MPQTLTCRRTGKPFEITDWEITFCDHMGVPPPDLCPEERYRDLMAFRNIRKLHRRKCDFTGEPIISAYPPKTPFPVYKNEIWWSDQWNATDYGRDIDFSRPFFEQFAELQKVVPREGTSVFNSENCEYNSHIRNSRNCYLNALSAKCEDTHYGYWCVEDKDVVDSDYTNYSTLCYECVDVNSSYGCIQLQEAKDCHECYFSFQLQNCRQCIFSSNLVNAEYMAFNKKVSPEEFESIKAKYLNGSYQSYQEAVKKFEELKNSIIHRASHFINCENCSGEHIFNSRNCLQCFDAYEAEDCAYAISVGDHSKNIYVSFSAGWPGCELVYYSQTSRGSTNIAFCGYTFHSSDLFYCNSMNASHDCFGCISLQQKKYAILNKVYSEEEYRSLKAKLIEHMKKTGEWGRFFPPSLSPYAYNETAAIEYMPLKEKEAIAMGFSWLEEHSLTPNVPDAISTEKLPDAINKVPDDILKHTLLCSVTQKPFRLTPYELKLYRQLGLPLPRLHPEERSRLRFHKRNPLQLFDRTCDQCSKQIKTTYTPARPEKVVCEECYLKQIY